MYKFLFVLIYLFFAFIANSQNGLERIIVEKYYISDANDAAFNDVGGVLPVGSVTYRVYVDMLPEYKFQSCYGTEIPLHKMQFSTSTRFFNNEDRGGFTPVYNKNSARNNTVMLDSWISGGAGCVGNVGVPKYLDNGLDNVVNNNGILKNEDPMAGIPLTQQDGLVVGTPNQIISAGIADGVNGLNALLDNLNDAPLGAEFSTIDGLWGVPGGSIGLTTENIVLIGQFTTDGEFSFELNIQIGTPTPGGVEQYVARDAVDLERTIPSMIYPDTSIVKTFELANLDFSIFPNPAIDEINLVFDHINSIKNTYRIYDITGAIVAGGNLPSLDKKTSFPLNISNLQKGIFLIQLMLDGKVKTSKFIKI